MQEGLRTSALRHGFLHPEAQLFGEPLGFGRNFLLPGRWSRRQYSVFQWILRFRSFDRKPAREHAGDHEKRETE